MTFPVVGHEKAAQVRVALETMPNMSKTSRSYQLAEGQISVMVLVTGSLPV